MAQYLIKCTKDVNDETLFGFKVCDSKQANLYMHCINLLSEDNETWYFNDQQLNYESDDFEVIKITNSEMKTLCKLFNLDYLNESTIIGALPDAINDAYEYNLINEDEDDIDAIEDEF